MKPETKVKYAILDLAAIWNDEELPKDLTEDQVLDLWDEAEYLEDAISEIRYSGVETGLEGRYSRHYESEEVAIQCPNGDWVGFTYWHGGGKFGEPGAIEWIEYAYDLECKEEEKLVVVRKFTKKEN
ncbi:MAG: hypothetical protein [Myoviridae sp. ctThM1]|nr:MAG: hypothetical protein [Myoviridae sp. ctThM1]